MAILQPNYIHINYVGDFNFPTMEEMMSLLQDRMKQLQSYGFSMEQVPLIRFLPQEELDLSLQQINEYIDTFVDYKEIDDDNEDDFDVVPLIKFIP